MGNKAMALACSEDNEAAQTVFDEALALAPNNYDLAVNYLSFVYNTEGLEAAQAYAASYMELVGEESSFYSQMQSQIDYIEQYEELSLIHISTAKFRLTAAIVYSSTALLVHTKAVSASIRLLTSA